MPKGRARRGERSRVGGEGRCAASFKSHVVIRVRADKLSRLPQSIEHGEVDSRQDRVVIVTQIVEEQGVP